MAKIRTKLGKYIIETRVYLSKQAFENDSYEDYLNEVERNKSPLRIKEIK
jgi:hypothetical protein